MKISQLIQQLEVIGAAEGDIEVVIELDGGREFYPAEPEIRAVLQKNGRISVTTVVIS